MDIPWFVKNGKSLFEAMGYWPSFHDAKVVDVFRDGDAFVVTAHLFVMTDQVNSAGYYVLEKHNLVVIAMRSVVSNSLPLDYSSYCLEELSFHRADDLAQLRFVSHVGQDGAVTCSEVEIASVTPCSAKGVAIVSDNSF